MMTQIKINSLFRGMLSVMTASRTKKLSCNRFTTAFIATAVQPTIHKQLLSN